MALTIGRKLYFDSVTGNVLLDTGERSGSVRETTREEDFQVYNVLAERVPETVGVRQLAYGQDNEKFGQYAYHMDTATNSIVWDLTPIQQEEVIAQATLEEEVASLKQLAGITPPVANPMTLEDSQMNKVYELKGACEAEILAGFYSTCRGTAEWFTNSRDDQNNLIGQAVLASSNPLFVPLWKSSTDPICVAFTAEQIGILATEGGLFKQERIVTLENSVVAVMSVDPLSPTAIEEVGEIVWVEKVWS